MRRQVAMPNVAIGRTILLQGIHMREGQYLRPRLRGSAKAESC